MTLTTRAKILLTSSCMTLIAMLVGFTGYRGMAELRTDLALMYDNYVVAESYVADIVSSQQSIVQTMMTAVIARSAEETQRARSRVMEMRTHVDSVIKVYEPTIISAEERPLAERFFAARRDQVAFHERVFKHLDAKEYDAATALYAEQGGRVSGAVLEAGKRLVEFQIVTSRALRAQAGESIDRSSGIIVLAIIAALAIGLLSSWLLIRSIVAALNQGTAVADRIARGEINQRIVVDREDEFGALLRSLERMDRKLGEVVSDVSASSDSVGSAARQLAQGTDDLSSRTQQQAAALEQTTSSMEEFNASVKQTAENAAQANRIAGATRVHADEGGTVVANAIAAMTEINASSKRIGDIIGVIDEIAFQTNLLALNAAVEAARAGEQGRGFAVVAAEVRSLAQRSARAAKEIKGLIGDSIEKVENGSALVERTGTTLNAIIESVKRLTNIVAEISAASEEQSMGIDQVNTALAQIDHMTQQNAALVEQASSASQEMQTQAQHLIEKMSYFSADTMSAARARVAGATATAAKPIQVPQHAAAA